MERREAMYSLEREIRQVALPRKTVERGRLKTAKLPWRANRWRHRFRVRCHVRPFGGETKIRADAEYSRRYLDEIA